MAGEQRRGGSKGSEQGNFISEWFGHRVYPVVAKKGLEDQQGGRCPFLSVALGEDRPCVKPPTSSGICTISSCSNGPRQDWLVCPYRALDRPLLEKVVKRLFRAKGRVEMFPAPTLVGAKVRERIGRAVKGGVTTIVYLQDKLGGEISLSATDRSPEVAFDTTMVEVVADEGGQLSVGRYGILEIQTMDFHGSYRYAEKNLRDSLRLHRAGFPKVLQENQGWLSDHIEGPNIANVFKRTFYQIMLKFRIGAHPHAVGCVLAVPASVWDSWQRHLGAPDLRPMRDGTHRLAWSGAEAPTAWIYVFDLDVRSDRTPNPIVLSKVIATDADSLAHYALQVAPDAAVAEGGSADRVLARIRSRLSTWWPDLGAPKA